MTQPNAKLVEVARAIEWAFYADQNVFYTGGRDLSPLGLYVGNGNEVDAVALARAAVAQLMDPSVDLLSAALPHLAYGASDPAGSLQEFRDGLRAMLAKVLEEEG